LLGQNLLVNAKSPSINESESGIVKLSRTLAIPTLPALDGGK